MERPDPLRWAAFLERGFRTCRQRVGLQWLERPSAWLPVGVGSQRDRYTEEHLFVGVVRMKTRLVPKKLRRPKVAGTAAPAP